MLRMYLLQCWFNLSNEGVEDATTLLHFRHLLEKHGIWKLFFDAINRCLERTGRMMREDDEVVYGDSAFLYVLARADGFLHPAWGPCAL